ncbi:MAG: HAD family phosphatase [Lachnospiraceae bacterium]|nr:HAD family phosphatase [Lachnospiraceae bacterium]
MEKLKDVKAVIFDLDGTLIDTEKLYRFLWPAALAHFGFVMDDERALEIRSLGRPFSPAQFKAWYGESFDYYQVRDYRKVIFADYVDKHGIDRKPGAEELLHYLRGKGYITAICTATDPERTKNYLKLVGLDGNFDKIISATMVERGKPAPDVYRFACEQLGLKPEECVAVEDAPNGIKSAHGAGMRVIMVPDQTEPDEEIKGLLSASVDSLEKIIDML